MATDEHGKLLNTKGINKMYWTTCSPDLNYIKFNLDRPSTGERNRPLTKKND